MARKTPSEVRKANKSARDRRPVHRGIARCTNGKRRYAGRHNALLGLRSARQQAGRSVRAGFPTPRQECRVYRCGRCDGWHLTSMPLAIPRSALRLAPPAVLPPRIAA